MNENIFFTIGVITGLFCSVLAYLAIRWIIKKKTNGSFKEYDERQLLARGKAAKYGFSVTIFYMLMAGILAPKGLATDFLMYLGACLGLAVFGCTCIILDAYFPLYGQSPTRIALIIFVFIIAAISNLALGLYPLNDANLMNLLLGIMLVIVLLVLIGKLFYDKKKEDDHEA